MRKILFIRKQNAVLNTAFYLLNINRTVLQNGYHIAVLDEIQEFLTQLIYDRHPGV